MSGCQKYKFLYSRIAHPHRHITIMGWVYEIVSDIYSIRLLCCWAESCGRNERQERDSRRSTKRSKIRTLVKCYSGFDPAGEPFRIITNGLPELAGASMLERRRFMHQHFDHIRRALMWEPRGHFNMYGCVTTPPVTLGADLGVLFMHNEGYSTMCGHGIIALVTTLVET